MNNTLIDNSDKFLMRNVLKDYISSGKYNHICIATGYWDLPGMQLIHEELKSFLIYKVKGQSAYLNHIANYGSKQNLINLWKKFYTLLNNQKINHLDLWCDTLNLKALNMYNIESFKNFPLKNYIYKAIFFS